MGKPRQPEHILELLTKIGANHVAENGAPAVLSPVVNIPGVGGNQLYAELNVTDPKHWYCSKQQSWYMVWLALAELFPGPYMDCWSDNIKLNYNNNNGTYSNASGVQIEVWEPWSTLGFEYLDPSFPRETIYFAGVVNALLGAGYQRGKNLLGAPYDWRLGPKSVPDYMVGLQAMIENAYASNNNTKVSIVAHSMGNLFFLTLVQQLPQAWKDKYIKAYIAVSPPWTGAFEAVQAITSGYDFSIPYLLPESARAVQRSFESNYFLMPLPNVWGDYVVVTSPSKNYTVSNYADLFNTLGWNQGYDMFLGTSNVYDPTIPPNVNTYCFYGYNVPTNIQMIFEKNDLSKQPKVVLGDGDGTVPRDSLTFCQNWQGKMNNTFVIKGYNKMEHVDLLNCAEMIADMLNAIMA